MNTISAKINLMKQTNKNHLHDTHLIIVFDFTFIDKFNLNKAISNDNQQRN